MASSTSASASAPTTAAIAPRRKRAIGQRRGANNGRGLDIDDDSVSDGSGGTDDDLHHIHDSDTSLIDDASSPIMDNKYRRHNKHNKPLTEAEVMLHGMSLAADVDQDAAIAPETKLEDIIISPPKSPSGPVIVSSASVTKALASQQQQQHQQQQPVKYDDYRRRRDADPAFVPNRGAFFMHDQRRADGNTNGGFQRSSFGRGRGRGGGGSGGGGRGANGNGGGYNVPFGGHMKTPSVTGQQRFGAGIGGGGHPGGGVGGPMGGNGGNGGPVYHPHHDPTTSGQWTHDMHETVVNSASRRAAVPHEGPPNGNGFIPTCKDSTVPINRSLSTEKHIGTARVRVFLPQMNEQRIFSGMAIKQYTKLPDHRPPLRRDKPVRISLPDRAPRYVFPASDRSFTFIPRAMRPNQQRMRGKPRSNWGSVGGYSRRNSVFGGSFYGSAYSPSINLSRRSSVVYDQEQPLFSPTGSAISRAHLEPSRPVVRLPPTARADFASVPHQQQQQHQHQQEAWPGMMMMDNMQQPTNDGQQQQQAIFHSEKQQQPPLPMHQPRPKKNISVADIELPSLANGPSVYQQQAFHQQMLPLQLSNGGMQTDGHGRRASYSSQHTSGTPLSHIPERAIHAAPFQPVHHAHQGSSYGHHSRLSQHSQHYTEAASQHMPQDGYYYPPGYAGPPSAGYSGPPSTGYSTSGHYQDQQQQHHHEHQANANLVAQEVNGMVYYYDAAQMQQQPNTYSTHHAPQQQYSMGMQGMMTPSPDGFFYQQQQQPAPGMMYYSQ